MIMKAQQNFTSCDALLYDNLKKESSNIFLSGEKDSYVRRIKIFSKNRFQFILQHYKCQFEDMRSF